MAESIHTFNEWHLGDNLIHINFLRRLSKRYPGCFFRHYCNNDYLAQLDPFVQDCVNVSLGALVEKPKNAIDSWIGSDRYFFDSPLRFEWAAFHLDWFDRLAVVMGLRSPIISLSELLFDYPALYSPTATADSYDFMIINSQPLSRQTPDFDPQFLSDLAKGFLSRGYKVITTHPTGFAPSTLAQGLKLAEIGVLSTHCSAVVGIPNGPMWPTLNVLNAQRNQHRVMWIGTQNLCVTRNCVSCSTSGDLSAALACYL